VARLRDKNAQVIELPNDDGKVDLPALLRELARRGVNELHVEAGFKLNGSLIREGCVDELLVYLAPMLIGEAVDMAHLPELSELAHARRLVFREVTLVGGDVRILARWAAPGGEASPSPSPAAK
jgi:diaminohydroxyphosphoribosylaminopyrimidine deaminase/5-amino-6-(5-phosphoribosylamino)uracil reductase